MRPIVGPELEFYVLERTTDSAAGWRRYGEATGNVYVAGLKGDPENVLLRNAAPAWPPTGSRSCAANHEFASGQFEINLWHSEALDAADRAFRFKTAIQELARRDGQARHVHGQAVQRRGRLRLPPALLDLGRRPATALFDDPDGEDGLSDDRAVTRSPASSPTRRRWPRCCNPTINSYKRFGPDTLAPWLIDWGLDNRSAMVRIPPERGEGVPDGAAARRRQRQPLPGDRRACWRRPTSASATSSSRRRRSRATATTPSKADDAAAATWPTRSTRSRPTPSSASVLGEALRSGRSSLQAQRARAVRPLGHRLGVPRVRLPPLTAPPSRPGIADRAARLARPGRRLQETPCATHSHSGRRPVRPRRVRAQRGAGASSTRCAREDPVHWNPSRAEPRLLGGHQARRHLAVDRDAETFTSEQVVNLEELDDDLHGPAPVACWRPTARATGRCASCCSATFGRAADPQLRGRSCAG